MSFEGISLKVHDSRFDLVHQAKERTHIEVEQRYISPWNAFRVRAYQARDSSIATREKTTREIRKENLIIQIETSN